MLNISVLPTYFSFSVKISRLKAVPFKIWASASRFAEIIRNTYRNAVETKLYRMIPLYCVRASNYFRIFIVFVQIYTNLYNKKVSFYFYLCIYQSFVASFVYILEKSLQCKVAKTSLNYSLLSKLKLKTTSYCQ